MKLTKQSFEHFLLSRSPRTKVGDRTNPLRSYLSVMGTDLNAVLTSKTSPKWLKTFIETVQSRRGVSISANAARNLLNTI